MSPPYMDGAALRRALPMATAIEALAEVLAAAAEGAARAPPRTVVELGGPGGRGSGYLLSMPAVWHRRRAAAVKVVTYIADNPAAGRPALQGVATLLDADDGRPRLLADAAVLTAIRTGALVGLATRYLARRDARVLGLIGTGALARDLAAGVAAVRRPERVVVYNRTRRRAEAFVRDLPWPAELRDSPEEVAAAADVLVTATSSGEPVVAGTAIRPGTHINAVGNFRPTGRELDGATVAACRRFVDSLENALAEAGELILAAREGLIPGGEAGIEGDLAALVTGAVAGRTGPQERTLFKCVGTALADLAALVAAAGSLAPAGRGVGG